MEQLPCLQARIANLKELRDLMRALRALAASHVQEAQAALPGIRRYVQVVEDAIAEGAVLLREAPGPPPAPAGEAVLITVCSEYGFAGPFNERLLEYVRRDGRVFLSSTTIDGEYWIRLAVLSFRTHKREIDLCLDILMEGVAQVEKELASAGG